MLQMSSEDGTRLLIYICEEEDRYFDCEMAPPVAGNLQSIDRLQATQWFCTGKYHSFEVYCVCLWFIPLLQL